MKKTVFVSGALFLSTTSMGLIFKIMHWPSAYILIVIGLILFSLVFVPTLAKYLYHK